ncbi:type II toxin-antitoxin system death-on-curing family toxin [Oceanimonas smirnovii]|uniref:type II toxin-antitoxin system death-on-curing family toxin n=1 Tax=Oceanimonas smirnovii TaxID=264574 RepID=UPI00037FE09E|nr:type II toxin-antitoxin system death-on-curing family toxin [Oceanimonas smirnovii]
MSLLHFSTQRVLEINTYILRTSPGFRGGVDVGKLEGALGRIDNAMLYNGLDDVFLIAAKYAASIGVAHAFSDANKRTGLAVCLEYLSLNDYDITSDTETLADATVDLITGKLPESDFADILYGLWLVEQ